MTGLMAHYAVLSMLSRQELRMQSAVHYPPTGDKKKIKKKKIEPKLNSKDEHSKVEDVSEESSVRSNRSNTSNETTPRKKDHNFGIDHHIKYNKNERLKHCLKEKNKIYRQYIKEEKVKKKKKKKKKREEREKMINDKVSNLKSGLRYGCMRRIGN